MQHDYEDTVELEPPADADDEWYVQRTYHLTLTVEDEGIGGYAYGDGHYTHSEMRARVQSGLYEDHDEDGELVGSGEVEPDEVPEHVRERAEEWVMN